MAPTATEFNADELQAPDWLNRKFFQDVLQKSEKENNIEILDLKLSPATAKGDHYASVMFRASVEYRLNDKVKHKSMILKTMPESEGNKLGLLENSHIFETEIAIYLEVIPKFESILREVGDHTIFGPPCIYCSLSPKKIIIFEDIVPMGYEVLRGRKVNLKEVKAAYTKIAKWHAISYKMNFEQPKLFDKFRHGIFSIEAFLENDTYKDGITNFIEMLGEHSDLVKYKKYFEPLESNILSYCKDAYEEYHKNPQSSALYVLCHGDFHFKNMMFKNNSETGRLEDVMLLDYQMSYMGPIGNDIKYSMFMLLSPEQRTKHLDELLYQYFTTFQNTLKKIGFKGDIPKVIELKHQLTRNKNLELYLLTTFLPLWDSFSTGTVDPDDLLFSAETRKMLFKNRNYINQVREMLPIYLYKGYLENVEK